MAPTILVRVFKDHENKYWIDKEGTKPLTNDMALLKFPSLPGRYFGNNERTVEYRLDWLPRTTEMFSRNVLGEPSFENDIIISLIPSKNRTRLSDPTSGPVTELAPVSSREPIPLSSREPTPLSSREPTPLSSREPTPLSSRVPTPLSSREPTSHSLTDPTPGHSRNPTPGPSSNPIPGSSRSPTPGQSGNPTTFRPISRTPEMILEDTDIGEVEVEYEEADGFGKNETKFFIELMRQHLLERGNDLPSSIVDLQNRIQMGKGQKRKLWLDFAERMTAKFSKKFHPDKLKRKWSGLQDSFKKAKKHNETTGRAPSRFQYFTEMQDLIGGQHDISFPVTATAQGIEVHRPEEIDIDDDAQDLLTPRTPAGRTRRTSKRTRENEEFISYLRESDREHNQTMNRILDRMESTENMMERFFTELLKK